MKFKLLMIFLVPTIVYSLRSEKYQLFYGIKTSYPQILSASVCYMRYEEKIGYFDPYFQIEPGLAGNKLSAGLASNSEKFAVDESLRLKLVYMNIWAFQNRSWPSKYGYLGPEVELMAALPSIHFGVYSPLDKNPSFKILKLSFGLGIGF